MELKQVDVDSLIAYPENARTHNDKQVAQIAESIKEFGFCAPCLVDEKGVLIAGHGRLMAAQTLGLKTIPTISIEHLTPEQVKAYRLADNQLALNAGWDFELLGLELGELNEGGFNLDLLGFDPKELETLLERTEGLTDPDEVPEEPETPVTKAGDLWLLGNHRLLCDDSESHKSVLRCVGGVDVDMVFTSPPYNVGIDYGKYDDKKGTNEYKSLIEAVMCNCFSVLGEGRLLAWNVGVSPKSKPHHHMIWLENAGFDLFRHIVWKKTGAQIPLWQNSKNKPYARNYKPNYNHEMIYMVSKGDVCYGNSTQMPSELSMDVWDVAQFSAGGKGHPAAFPAKLATLAVDVMSAPGEIMLEPFCGSGTMIIAAEVKGRKCCAIEMDPVYCDVAVTRWQNFTGKDATLETGETFKERSIAQAN